MKRRTTVLSLLAAFALLTCFMSTATAQEDTITGRPMYGHPKPNLRNDMATAATPLKTWNGSFTYQGSAYHYNMVGTVPKTGTSTTVPVFVIPVVLQYVTSTGTTTFSPNKKDLERADRHAEHGGFPAIRERNRLHLRRH